MYGKSQLDLFHSLTDAIRDYNIPPTKTPAELKDAPVISLSDIPPSEAAQSDQYSRQSSSQSLSSMFSQDNGLFSQSSVPMDYDMDEDIAELVNNRPMSVSNATVDDGNDSREEKTNDIDERFVEQLGCIASSLSDLFQAVASNMNLPTPNRRKRRKLTTDLQKVQPV